MLAAPDQPRSAKRQFEQELHRLRYTIARTYYRLRRALGGPDFLDELDYWEGYFRAVPPTLAAPDVRRAAFPSELRECAAILQRELGRVPRVLEVGSGPVSLLAAGVDERLVKVTAVDPLARPYEDLLALNCVEYPIRPVTGHGENLTKFHKAGFEIVYSSNSLDHTKEPVRCFDQMCSVLAPGGYLLLEGFVREGSQGGWLGLHQHDLFLAGEDLIHVDRLGKRSNLTKGRALTHVASRVLKFQDRGISSFGYDIPDWMPEAPVNEPWDWRLRDWFTILLRKHEPVDATVARSDSRRERLPLPESPIPVGDVSMGQLRRPTPISSQWGFDRGLPVDRFYIERFLARHESDIRGRVLEVGDDSYTRRFGGEQVEKRDVLHVREGAPGATIVADLADAGHIPSDLFDCVIFTQTLHLIYDFRAALLTLHRILRPGGVLLATFPGISQIDRNEWADSWYWSFTSRSAERFLGEAFPAAEMSIEAHGNVLAATSFLYGLAAEELTPEELEFRDPAYELVLTVRVRKPPVESADKANSGA